MKRVLKIAEGTGGRTISNSTMRLVVQDYWRKLGYPGTLCDDGRRPKNVTDSKVRTGRSPQSELSVTQID
jgi:hypothetical protein